MVDIQYPTAYIKRGKNKKERRKTERNNIQTTATMGDWAAITIH